MSELGDDRLRARLGNYRYLHCRMRARARYDIDLTWDQYNALCDYFKSPESNYWKTDTGAQEAWIPLGETLVCAQYRPQEGLVVTLMPPPDTLTKDELSDTGIRLRALELESELKKLKTHEFHDFGKTFKLGDYLVFLKTRLEQSQSVVVSEVGSWYKRQLQKVTSLLGADPVRARARLLILQNTPDGFNPLKDPEKASILLDAMVEEKIRKGKSDAI